MKRKISIAVLLACISICISFSLFAQSGGSFNINKSTINNGGGISSGGSFSVRDSYGQSMASSSSSGGAFKLSGGFWSVGLRPEPIYQNGFEN